MAARPWGFRRDRQCPVPGNKKAPGWGRWALTALVYISVGAVMPQDAYAFGGNFAVTNRINCGHYDAFCGVPKSDRINKVGVMNKLIKVRLISDGPYRDRHYQLRPLPILRKGFGALCYVSGLDLVADDFFPAVVGHDIGSELRNICQTLDSGFGFFVLSAFRFAIDDNDLYVANIESWAFPDICESYFEWDLHKSLRPRYRTSGLYFYRNPRPLGGNQGFVGYLGGLFGGIGGIPRSRVGAEQKSDLNYANGSQQPGEYHQAKIVTRNSFFRAFFGPDQRRGLAALGCGSFGALFLFLLAMLVLP